MTECFFIPGKSVDTFTNILSFDFLIKTIQAVRQYKLLKTMNITVMHFS